MNLFHPNKNLIYCWRYEKQSEAKIGVSTIGGLYQRIAAAKTFSIYDIELLGFQLMPSKHAAEIRESNLLNRRFQRVRSDREFIHLNQNTQVWLDNECMHNPLNWFKHRWQTFHEEGVRRGCTYQPLRS